MPLSDDDVAALRADLERVQREKETGLREKNNIVTRRGFSRRDTGGVSSSAWGGGFLPCFHLERRLLRRLR